MRRVRWSLGVALAGLLAAVIVLGASSSAPAPVLAQGVGRASWTPSRSTTEALPSRLLVDDDSIVYRTTAEWSPEQTRGLQRYLRGGLRYTHEVNDRSGRLSATGYWATNHPDPAFDRDDDDGDGRWEEAEITAGSEPPVPGATYSTLVQFSRWRGKREGGACRWVWDRRRGSAEVLSQLSRDLLGEWQAERFTLNYESLDYPRVDVKPALTGEVPPARCRERRPRDGQNGIVVTFSEPLSWARFTGLRQPGTGSWTAWEAIGSYPGDRRPWTCGGPMLGDVGLEPCRQMGVRPDGVTAAVGFFDDGAIRSLRADPAVARVDALRDTVTDLLFDVGGFGVQRPDLTVNDDYWELFLAD